MLFCCTYGTLSHKRWGPIWTLQEAKATLPHRSPTLFFRGHCFSFTELNTAIGMIREVEGSPEKQPMLSELSEMEGSAPTSVISIFRAQFLQLLILRLPPLFRLRPGPEQRQRPGYNASIDLLDSTDIYHATGPRDKIFALQSLLPGYTGRPWNLLSHENITVNMLVLIRLGPLI
ncbi:hypothetical protein GGS26DRAFT_100329 [Hypomontagnella submonticulosa]|nr:hypothetical protein GGS26DRAFT_100329 [Hypomontagnella submonticulosa]